jgi:hypothetical protein
MQTITIKSQKNSLCNNFLIKKTLHKPTYKKIKDGIKYKFKKKTKTRKKTQKLKKSNKIQTCKHAKKVEEVHETLITQKEGMIATQRQE